VCVGCGAIQPPPPTPDPFEILGLEQRYFMDLAHLDEAWRKISRRVHPDRFAGKPAVMRRMSLQWTAAINSARRNLRDPERRARILATGNPDPPETRQAPTDPEFLETIFDLQMSAEDHPERTREQVSQMRDREQAQLDSIFTAWETGAGDLSEIERILGRLRYLRTALSQTD